MTPLDLTKRSEKGAPLSATEFDANYTALEDKLNAVINLIALIAGDDGTLKDGKISTAAMISNAIITLAKLAKVDVSEARKILRVAADGTIALEAFPAPEMQRQADAAAVASTGIQAGLLLSTFTFTGLPAGNVMIQGVGYCIRNAGDNAGTVWLKNGASVLAAAPTHVADAGANVWVPLIFNAVIEDYAGGDLTLTMEFQAEDATSDIVFGAVGSDGRFARVLTVLAGL